MEAEKFEYYNLLYKIFTTINWAYNDLFLIYLLVRFSKTSTNQKEDDSALNSYAHESENVSERINE